jgi:5-carboxymethyl-2-hydroxymuconate isomerase
MPHINLEYSPNIIEKNNLLGLFEEIHTVLVEMLPTQLASCKSRAIPCELYLVGDGHAQNAFVHLDLKTMAGRTETVLHNVGNHLLTLLTNHFAESARKYHLKVTVEISELQKTYFQVTT